MTVGVVVGAVGKFELAETLVLAVGRLELAFAFVEVDGTTAVDERKDFPVEVVLVVYDGPVERLMVVVEPADADDEEPLAAMWNGSEYCVKVAFCSS